MDESTPPERKEEGIRPETPGDLGGQSARLPANPAKVDGVEFRLGRAILVVCCLFAFCPLSCFFCISTSTVRFRMHHGSWPLDRDHAPIENGMTKAQVQAALGKPHSICYSSNPDQTTWMYFTDSFETMYYAVTFDENGIVVRARYD